MASDPEQRRDNGQAARARGQAKAEDGKRPPADPLEAIGYWETIRDRATDDYADAIEAARNAGHDWVTVAAAAGVTVDAVKARVQYRRRAQAGG